MLNKNSKKTKKQGISWARQMTTAIRASKIKASCLICQIHS